MSRLTREQRAFLEMTAAYLQNKTWQGTAFQGSLRELILLSQNHKLSPAVFESIRRAAHFADSLNDPLWQQWRREVLTSVLGQQEREKAFWTVYGALLEAGVKPLVVKGILCRSLYRKPDYRISADEDLVVTKEQFSDCDRELVRLGFRRQEFSGIPYELGYKNPQNGLYFEVHTALFDPESKVFGPLNSYFQKAIGEPAEFHICEKKIFSLDCTGHFLYLILHSYKHFLYSGFGVRQVCDMVRMAQEWKERIDWQFISASLNKLRLEAFFRIVLGVAAGYLEASGLAEELSAKTGISFETSEGYYEEVAEDILKGGIYGSSSTGRLHSAHITLAAMEGKDGIAKGLFPPRDSMERQYAFVKKSLLLLPLAYLLRIGGYIQKRLKANQESSLSLGRRRVAMMKKYGIIK